MFRTLRPDRRRLLDGRGHERPHAGSRAIANNCAQQCRAGELPAAGRTKVRTSCSAEATRCLQACRTKR